MRTSQAMQLTDIHKKSISYFATFLNLYKIKTGYLLIQLITFVLTSRKYACMSCIKFHRHFVILNSTQLNRELRTQVSDTSKSAS